MYSILLVEDSRTTHELVEHALATEVELDWAPTVAEAKRLLSKRTYDLILLDVMLPDGDGFQLCSLLQSDQSHSTIPIVFLTARTSVDDKVFGFSTGADDYISKPFDVRELKARVMTKLQKVGKQKKKDNVIRFGDIEVNLANQNVFVLESGQKKLVDLTSIEYKLLTMFLREPEKLCERDKILDEIWGQDVHVFPRNVDTHISKLRKKLGVYGRYIQCIRGVGYKMSLVKIPTLGPKPIAEMGLVAGRPDLSSPPIGQMNPQWGK